MLQFPGGVGFGVDVGNFLEFEGAFHGDGIVHAASEKQGMAFLSKSFCPDLDLRFHLQRVLQRDGQVPQRGDDLAFALIG